jgi:hypothetical protein
MKKHICNKKNGLHYTLGEDGYYCPNLVLPAQKFEIGRFGRMHLDYLKKHKKVLYNELFSSCRLNEYLHDIDTQALEMFRLLVKQYAAAQGITEQLKAENQMEWVGRMNNIRSCAEEVILNEIIYK